MARRFTVEEENKYREELYELYVVQNRTISEIADILKLGSFQTVYDRLKRLQIPTCREKKERCNNKRTDIRLPTRSCELAELLGVLLGDGSITHFQIWVTLGVKEMAYAKYVAVLIKHVFGGTPKIAIRGNNYKDVYLGSTVATNWLFNEGLVHNKVLSQVGVPMWIFEREEYMESFIKGFFDTDGSIYELRHGLQISLTNFSLPLLCSLQKMLEALRYHPSAISSHKVYLTRVPEIKRFFREIQPANPKHQRRFKKFLTYR
jgi:DNA-binding transcriptional regulator WhiA